SRSSGSLSDDGRVRLPDQGCRRRHVGLRGIPAPAAISDTRDKAYPHVLCAPMPEADHIDRAIADRTFVRKERLLELPDKRSLFANNATCICRMLGFRCCSLVLCELLPERLVGSRTRQSLPPRSFSTRASMMPATFPIPDDRQRRLLGHPLL